MNSGDAPRHNNPLHANALIFGKGTFLSRLLGLLRDAAIAALVGGGGTADALLLAFRIPNAARQLLAEGAFAYVLIPGYRAHNATGQTTAWRYIRSVNAALFLLLGAFALLGWIFAKPLVSLLAPGFSNAPEIRGLAVSFMGPCLFALPLMAGAGVASSALMAEGNFRPPAYFSAIFNAVIILTAGIAFALYGAGRAEAPYLLCWGTVLAGAAQWLYQSHFLRRAGFPPLGPVSLTAPETRRSLRALPSSVFGVGGYQANLLAAAFLASFLAEGSVSALYFAERLAGFPLGVIGASVGLAALSDLSAITAKEPGGAEGADKHALFALRLAEAGRITLFFAVPAAVGTACLAEPLTSLLFGRGAFAAGDIARTGTTLLAYVAGLPALAFIRPLLAGSGALRDTRTPFRAAVFALAATLAAGAILLPANAPWAAAFAVSLGSYVNAAVLIRALCKNGYAPLPKPAWLVKVLLANAVMAACVLFPSSLITSNLAKAGTVPLGIAAYYVAARLLRLEEAAIFGSVAKKLLRRI